ncbi:MAG: hypothetical protein NTW16_17170 [Bacteroidetes bacterium]|nr:hypothetical protein [Bacteroidota bacterium]
MKKVSILIMAFLLMGSALFSQVAVNTNGNSPDPSAMLDVSSTTHGLLIPRVSSGARDHIPSPATGLLIYNFTDKAFNFFNGSFWLELNMTYITSNVGTISDGGGLSVNLSSGVPPENSAMLDISDELRGLLVPRMSFASRDLIQSPATGLIIFNTDSKRFSYFNGNQWVTICAVIIGSTTGGGSQPSAGMAINTTNSPADPSAMLDVSATDKGILIPRLTTDQRNLILPAFGLLIYNTSTNYIEIFNGIAWYQLSTYLIESPGAGINIPSTNQIEWRWNPVSGANKYYWNTENDFNTARDLGTSTSYLETALACGTSYDRYVWAFNNCGASSPVVLTEGTSACSGSWSCGNPLIANHVSGDVAPATKSVTYGTVTGIPGESSKCWITSNLGADHQADSVNEETDAVAGWYWQFNRKQGYLIDGSTISPAWTINSINENMDWEAANEPCAIELGGDWRIPVHSEWDNVSSTGGWTDWTGSWTSDLKLHAAGYIYSLDGSLYGRGFSGNYWSSTQYNIDDSGWDLVFNSFQNLVFNADKAYGFSLRCIRENVSTVVIPTIETMSVNNIAATMAFSGGNVTSDGGAPVSVRGVCWSAISTQPSLSDSYTENGSGIGTFESELDNLTPNTLYYVAAFATNIAGTAYGDILTFTTAPAPVACPGIETITIHHAAGLVAPVSKTVTYSTVTNIPGESGKCWITSNLGADRQALAVDDASEVSAGWYWQFNRKQGYKFAEDGLARTPGTPWITSINENLDWEQANDPCAIELGSGWRIPTFTEWIDVYSTGNWTSWTGSWNSGLKLHEAGYLRNNDGLLSLRGSYGFQWSSSQVSWSNDSGWYLGFGNYVNGTSYDYKSWGFSIRCLRE